MHLVNLPPLFGRFLSEAFVDHWHDFVQQLTSGGEGDAA